MSPLLPHRTWLTVYVSSRACVRGSRVLGACRQYPTTKRDKIIQMLDQGKNMNLEVYEDDECSTALMEACAIGDEELVGMLLTAIFKNFNKTMATEKFINAQDDLSQTAYSEAAASGFVGICKKLLDAGADPNKHLTQKVTEHTFIDVSRGQ